MMQSLSWFRILAGLIVGTVLGALFGVVFGWTASWFANGPEVWLGIRESAPWFAVMGAVAGFLMGFEKK